MNQGSLIDFSWLNFPEGPVRPERSLEIPFQKHHPLFEVSKEAELLWAVSHNDLPAVQKLLSLHVDVNAKGIFNETPLHVAAALGHDAMVIYLLDHGADLTLVAYEGEKNPFSHDGYTPFELALANDHLSTMKLFLEKGILEHHSLIELEHMAWEKLSLLLDAAIAYQDAEDDSLISDLMEMIQILAEQTGTVMHHDPEQENDYPTMSMVLEIVAAQLSNPTIHSLLLDFAKTLDAIDNNAHICEQTKMLFHIIPVKGTFNISYNGIETGTTFETIMKGEGSFHNFVVPMAANAVQQYLQFGTMTLKEQKAFEHILPELQFAAFHVTRLNLESTAQDYFEAYQNGKTIVIPSGWDGHAVFVILNEPLNLLVIANNGSRHDAIHSGLNLFTMLSPENVTPELINQLLINEDQYDLEFGLATKLGLAAVDTVLEPDQFTGNCGWQSLESAVEGLLLVHFLEENHTLPEAKLLAQSFYHHWDAFQTQAFVESYFEHDPRVDVSALEALIQSHAFVVQANSLETFKEDSTGAFLLKVFTEHYQGDTQNLNFNYDPYEKYKESKLELFNSLPDEIITPEDVFQETQLLPLPCDLPFAVVPVVQEEMPLALNTLEYF